MHAYAAGVDKIPPRRPPSGVADGIPSVLRSPYVDHHAVRTDPRRSDVSSEWPARYEIRVRGILNRRWATWFEGLDVTSDSNETVVAGLLADQPALHGVLDRVRDLGLLIVSVRRLDDAGARDYHGSDAEDTAHGGGKDAH